MEAWVGPAIVAAFISGLVSLIVVQLNFAQSRKADRSRRAEKVRDFQVALRAEIRSELRNLSQHDVETQLADVRRMYESDATYSVTVPRPVQQAVFESLVAEIHVLPEAVIDPVVLYSRQRNVIAALVTDMREPTFRQLSKDQQLKMYEDYLSMWSTWREFAAHAEHTLSESISIPRTRPGLSGNRLGDG